MKLSEESKKEVEDFLQQIIRWFCHHPEDARIKILEGTISSIIEIYPHPEDVGAMIGRGGAVAIGIRKLIGAYSRVIDHRMHPEIVEGPKNNRRRRQRRREMET